VSGRFVCALWTDLHFADRSKSETDYFNQTIVVVSRLSHSNNVPIVYKCINMAHVH